MAGIKLIHLDSRLGKISDNPIFVGPVSIQEIVAAPTSETLTITSVTFADGARNRPHRHTSDQILVATFGRGFVASEDGELTLETGDVAFIPCGTRHWHGAQPDQTFSHLSIVTRGHTEVDEA